MKCLYLILSLSLIHSNNLYSKSNYETFTDMLDTELTKNVPVISDSNLLNFLESDNQIVLIDTRTPLEYSVSRIIGAINLNYEDFSANKIESIDKDSIVVLYCSVGVRSGLVGEELLKLGYNKVYNLYGGIFNWVNNGHKLYNNLGETDLIHGYSKEWSIWLTGGKIVY